MHLGLERTSKKASISEIAPAGSAVDGTRKKRGYDLGRNDDGFAGRIHPVAWEPVCDM